MTPAPRVCFVGPALGSHPGWVTTQGEVLAHLFEREGHPVRITSRQISRGPRAADTVACLVRWRRSIDVAVVSVFSGGAFRLAELSVRTCQRLAIPTVLWLHGGDLPTLFTTKPDLAKSVLTRGTAVVAPSRYLARAAQELGLECGVIPNVLDLDDTVFRRRTHADGRLLWMRTFHDIYNPRLALDAFGRLRRDHPEATLTMAGQDKGLLDDTRDHAAALGLADAVSFPGFLSAADKRAAFDRHDVFLNTNRVDNSPVTVLEAAAAGLPVVATAVGGLPDLLDDGHTGLLVPADDPGAMADAVARLFGDDVLVERLSTGGRALAEQSAWPVVRDAWLALFDEVL